MGAHLDKSIRDPRCATAEVFTVGRRRVVVARYEVQGWRNSMEDCSFAQHDAAGQRCCIGTLDGHGGNQCAKFATAAIQRHVAAGWAGSDKTADLLTSSIIRTDAEWAVLNTQVLPAETQTDAFRTACHEEMDATRRGLVAKDAAVPNLDTFPLLFSSSSDWLHNSAQMQWFQGILENPPTAELDACMQTFDWKQYCSKSGPVSFAPAVACLHGVRCSAGTTAVVAILEPSGDGLDSCIKTTVANTGDSRAVLIDYSDEHPGQATRDHKPTDEDEQLRILDAGGFCREGRVGGILAVSRALGDLPCRDVQDKDLAEQPITSRPELYEWLVTDCSPLLILASDGLWDAQTPEQVKEHFRDLVHPHEDDHVSSSSAAATTDCVCNDPIDDTLDPTDPDSAIKRKMLRFIDRLVQDSIAATPEERPPTSSMDNIAVVAAWLLP